MAIEWTVTVLAAGLENAEVVQRGAAGTEQTAGAAAAGALLAGARKMGRQEFWVTVGAAVTMVVPGLDDFGEVDITGLLDALDLVPAAVLEDSTEIGRPATWDHMWCERPVAEVAIGYRSSSGPHRRRR